MDSEIQRWRSIAASSSVSPDRRVSLVPRKQREQIARQRAQLSSEVRRISRISSSMKKATITDALDQATADMKKDTSILCSGYLNPNTMNQALEKAAQAFAVAEDAVKNEAQKKELKNDYGEEAHKKNLGSFVDLLECYDSVTHQRAQESKLTAKSKEAQEAEESEMEFQKHKTPIASTQRIILPNAHLNATKADQYKTFRLIDNAYVERSLYYSKQRDDKSKEHYSLLQSELAEAGCPDQGPDWTRLQIYGRCFDRVIGEFKSFGPLLAEIKRTYDATIADYQMNQDELHFLRNKVQKLLSQNQNRLLLKFEKKKCKRLEEYIEQLKLENERINEEAKRKLALYASYLPESVYAEKKNEDPILVEIEEAVKKMAAGQDPISVYEARVQVVQSELVKKAGELGKLEHTLQTEFVPKASKDIVDESLMEAKEKLAKVTDANRTLELQMKQLATTLLQMESNLKDKDAQYNAMSKKYSELAEAVSISFDKNILKITEPDL